LKQEVFDNTDENQVLYKYKNNKLIPMDKSSRKNGPNTIFKNNEKITLFKNFRFNFCFF
jgi:hypothetical protein